MDRIREFFGKIGNGGEGVLRWASLLFSGYLTAAFFVLIAADDYGEASYYESGFWMIIGIGIMFFAVFAMVYWLGLVKFAPHSHKYILLAIAAAYAVLLAHNNLNEFYFAVALVIVMIIIIQYTMSHIDGDKTPLDMMTGRNFNILLGVLVGIGVLQYTLFFGRYTVLRMNMFSAANFDLGIFAQMFESMANTGLPYTTVERNRHLSHFAIHFSPIFYLLLPAYMIFRSPAFLLYAQAFIVAAGVVPVVLIAKKLDFARVYIILAGLIYLLYPAFATGIFFDFHENRFLPVIILWMFYFAICKKYIAAYIAAIFLLMVKEDAALYAFCFAFWLFLMEDKKRWGLIVFGTALAWFLAVTHYINTVGEGIMINRFSLFLQPGQESLLDVLRNIAKDPALLLRALLSEGKLVFIIAMSLPLAFLPFMNKFIRAALFFIPIVVINLAHTWSFQYDIRFQYVYGTGAMLIFLFLINFRDLAQKYKPRVAATALIATLILFTNLNYRPEQLREFYARWGNVAAETHAVLAIVPRDASVTAHTFFTVHLADIPHLYAIHGNALEQGNILQFETQYMVLDIRGNYDPIHIDRLYRQFELVRAGGFARVYRRR